LTVRPATTTDLPTVRALLHESRHTFLTCGQEDLPDLLGGAGAVVGEMPGAGAGLWGFVAFDAPARSAVPGTLADGALRVALIGRTLPPDASPAQLIAQAIAAMQAADQPFQLTALTDEAWLVGPLEETGFATVVHLWLYQRTRHSLPVSPTSALLRPLHPDELPALAALDNLAFPLLWRMADAELLELIFTCRVQAAEIDGRMVGFAAISLHSAQDRYDENQAQFVRLAVHPAFQGQGIGRQLSIDSLAYAHSQGYYRIFLNTPESNPTAQRLYESLHFRRHGGRMPVLVFQEKRET